MTENTTEASTEDTGPIVYEKGSWQESLQKSSNLMDRSAKARKTASNLLWVGAKSGIEGWLPNSKTDVQAENLYGEVIEALGRSRKGDASKIKTVAVAVRTHSLDLSAYPNLSKAYAEATRLTKTVKAQAEEDDAAEKAIESIEVPKSTTTVDGAALILLSKGVDGAVVAILDALGPKNEAAHRAFLRAVGSEITARVQANKPPKPAPAPKKQATASKTAAPKATPVKGKPKGKPAAKASAPKAEAPAPVETEDDLLAEIEAEDSAETTEVTTPAVPVAKKAVGGKGRPVVRRPARATA